MIISAAPIRGIDRHGSGAWGAPRGKGRTHKGVDYVMWPGSLFLSPIGGTVTKLGYAYEDAPGKWEYVELVKGPYRVRFFYITPSVAVGQIVRKGDPIGVVEDLRLRYPGMTPHVHISMWRGEQRLNPDLELEKLNFSPLG